MRQWRAKKRKEKELTAPDPVTLADPVGALADWSRDNLIVPAGHPLAGEAMTLPDFAGDFLRRGWNSHESALTCGRKNAKSAICGILGLGFLCGPLRQNGFRMAIASLSKEKSNELRQQIEQIGTASGLRELTYRKSPYPGRITSLTGSVEVLSSDRTAGHSSSFDLVIVDETGLFPERARELLSGLRSSLSAKGGRLIHISVRGDAILFDEILNNPMTTTAIYEAAADCELNDRSAWAAANPGLGTIKQISYMESEAARVAHVPSDEPEFRAYDLNCALSPQKEMLCSPDDIRRCFVDELPPRRGSVYLGLDMGEATSASACAAIWPTTGRVELWMAFGDIPTLRERGKRDGADYVLMEKRGELKTYPGRVTPVALFMADVAEDLRGCRVAKIAGDSFKDSEILDFLDRARLRWPREFRRVGAGKDGGADVRAFQRLVLNKRLKMRASLALSTAIANSIIRRDGNGNPGLDKSKSRGRIDLLSAAVIAGGLAESFFDKVTRPSWRSVGAIG